MGIVSSRPQINSKLKFVTSFLHNPKLKENKTILAIWLVTAAITVIAKLIIGKFNNYKIFEGVYNHAIHGLTLYGPYPEEYGDVNLYGIIFSFIISPFAILPQWLGMVLWVKKSKSDNILDCIYRIDNSPVSPAIQYICRCLYPVGFCFYRKEKRFLGSICHIARYICKNIFNCRTGFLLFIKTQDKILTILFILDDPFIHIPDSFLWIGIYDKPVSGLVYCHH